MRKTIYITILISACILCSCTGVPKPTKMQAAYDWHLLAANLAADIAKQVKLTLRDRESDFSPQIYLEQHDKSLFRDVFDNLLKTQFFKHGIRVTGSEGATVKMKYEIQMVARNELIVTTEVTTVGAVIAHRSKIYYINDQDAWHYCEMEMPTKNYAVVSE